MVANGNLEQKTRGAVMANRVADRVRTDLEAPLRKLVDSAALRGDSALPPEVAAAANTIARYLDSLEHHLGDLNTTDGPGPRLTMALASELSFLARHLDTRVPGQHVERLQPRVRRAARLATLWLTPYGATSTTTVGPDSESTAAWRETRTPVEPAPAEADSPAEDRPPAEEAPAPSTVAEHAVAPTPDRLAPADEGAAAAGATAADATAADATAIVHERMAELRARVSHLEEQIELRDRYWRFSTHELRNAAHAFALTVERMSGSGADAPWIEPLIRTARTVVQRAEEALSDRGLDVAPLSVEPVMVDLVEVALGSLEQARPLAEAAGVKLVGERLPLGQPIWAHADPERTDQILHNLLRNAIQATPHGGHVILECSYMDGCAALIVSDTGPGVPAEEAGDLFALSRRGADGDGNFGIGLPVSDHLARAMGGSLELADSQPGLGGRVRLRLRRADA